MLRLFTANSHWQHQLVALLVNRLNGDFFLSKRFDFGSYPADYFFKANFIEFFGRVNFTKSLNKFVQRK